MDRMLYQWAGRCSHHKRSRYSSPVDTNACEATSVAAPTGLRWFPNCNTRHPCSTVKTRRILSTTREVQLFPKLRPPKLASRHFRTRQPGRLPGADRLPRWLQTVNDAKRSPAQPSVPLVGPSLSNPALGDSEQHSRLGVLGVETGTGDVGRRHSGAHRDHPVDPGVE